jgi:hypothetical protein
MPTQIPENPNAVVFVKGDNFTPSDLSSKDWADETKVGCKLSASLLPPNVKVLGTPLMEGDSITCLDLQNGGFGYTRNGVEIFQCLPRITVGGITTDLIVPSKILKVGNDAAKKKETIGYSGTLSDGTQVSVSIWASPIRDDTGVQLNFTSPIGLPAFNYELVFTTSKVDTLRFFTANKIRPFNFKAQDYPLKDSTQFDFPVDVRPVINFLSEGEYVANYTFSDLYERAKSAYLKIDSGAVVIGFRFDGLAIGEQFDNDGYFGSGEGTSNQNDATGYLSGSHFINTVGDGNVTKLGFKFDDASPNGTCRIGLFADTGGVPGALLGGGVNTVAVANGWVEDTGLSIAVTNGVHFWIGYSMSADNTVKTEGTSNYWKAFAYANLPNPFGAAALDASYGYCMRAYVVLTSAYIPKSGFYPKILAH